MSAVTSIQWTDRTWNPIRGCSRVSEGCRFCYAEQIATRFSGPGQPYEGLVNVRERHGINGSARTGLRGQWNGQIRFVDHALAEPLSWRKPQKVFVNSMSDLFHENVKDEQADRIFATMALAQQHTFQILTKRPARMREYLTRRSRSGQPWKDAARSLGHALEFQGISLVSFPLPNVWIGASVENRDSISRIDELRQTPAAVRFLSLEPLLEDLGQVNLAGIHWVILGGESGPHARTCDRRWLYALIDQCRASGVAVFVKQLGAKSAIDGGPVERFTEKGGDWTRWPPDLKVREFPA